MPKSNKKSSTEDFIRKAVSIHGDKYDYSMVEYVNNKTHVKLRCNSCGNEFDQRPDMHIGRRSGCRECSGAVKLTTETFIEKAIDVHGDAFGYHEVNYINNKQKVKIFCNKGQHFFNQRPDSHLRGIGCSECSKTRKMSASEFVQRATKRHGDIYTYDNAMYEGHGNPITITCPTHGDFEQKANNHLNGAGCPSCYNDIRHIKCPRTQLRKNLDAGIPCWVYRVRIYNEEGIDFEKIGITTKRTIDERFHSLNAEGYSMDIVDAIQVPLGEAHSIEGWILEELEDSGMRYKVNHLRKTRIGGWTECFPLGVLDKFKLSEVKKCHAI